MKRSLIPKAIAGVEARVKPSWRRWVLAAAIVVGAGLRVGHLVAVQKSEILRTPEMTPDPTYNHGWAKQAAGLEPREIPQPYYVAPLYIEALGLLYRIAGAHPLYARIIQLAMGIFTPLLIYLIATRLTDPRAAVTAAALAAVFETYIFYEAALIKESILVFFACLSMVVALVALRRTTRRGPWWGLAGLLMGVTCLIRPNVLLFVPMAGLVLLAEGRRIGWRSAALSCASWGLGTGLAILPVTLRNWFAADDLVLISANGGFSFFVCNRPGAEAFFQALPNVSDSVEGEARDTKRWAEREIGRTLKMSEVSQFFFDQGWAMIRADWGDSIRRCLRKALFVVNALEVPNTENLYFSHRFSPVLRLPLMTYGALFPWFLLGLIVCWRRRPESLLINLFILCNVVSMVVFYVTARYRLPITPWVIIYAAAAFWWVWDRLRRRHLAPVFAAMALVGGGYAMTYYRLPPRDPHTVWRPREDFSQPMLNAARYYTDHGDPRRALDLLREAQSRWGPRASLLEQMGTCLMAVEDYEQARAALDQAIALAPDFPNAYFERGRLLIRLGQLPAAARDFKDVLQVQPEAAEAHYYLGAIRRSLGDLSESLSYLERAHQLDPDLLPVYAEMALVYAKQDRLDQARAILREGLSISPGNPRFLGLLEEFGEK